jgi:hypothetical protein
MFHMTDHGEALFVGGCDFCATQGVVVRGGRANVIAAVRVRRVATSIPNAQLERDGFRSNRH